MLLWALGSALEEEERDQQQRQRHIHSFLCLFSIINSVSSPRSNTVSFYFPHLFFIAHSSAIASWSSSPCCNQEKKYHDRLLHSAELCIHVDGSGGGGTAMVVVVVSFLSFCLVVAVHTHTEHTSRARTDQYPRPSGRLAVVGSITFTPASFSFTTLFFHSTGFLHPLPVCRIVLLPLFTETFFPLHTLTL